MLEISDIQVVFEIEGKTLHGVCAFKTNGAAYRVKATGGSGAEILENLRVEVGNIISHLMLPGEQRVRSFP